MARSDACVVVVGGGAAGFAAARVLAEAEVPTLLLEARPRLFGRVDTIHPKGWPSVVERGAEFVHNDGPQTLALAREARVKLETVPERRVMLEDGILRRPGDLEATVQRLVAGERRRSRDRSLGDLLASKRPRRERDIPNVRFFVEGYHAADVDRISARALVADDDPAEGSQRRVREGYAALLRGLLDAIPAGLVSVRKGVAVAAIRWRRGRVTLTLRRSGHARESTIEARACIVTAPLAVLKAGAIDIRPRPAAWPKALSRLETGAVQKLILLFREPFWRDARCFRRRALPSFWHARGEAFPTWWTSAPRLPILTGWAGGPAAHRLDAATPDEVVAGGLASLARMLRIPRAEIESALIRYARHDWTADPWSRGAYSYVAVGGQAAQKTLARPVEGTLVLAGEALSPDAIGTVEGALASGHAAARALLRAMR
jgi:monoamine oxidase